MLDPPQMHIDEAPVDLSLFIAKVLNQGQQSYLMWEVTAEEIQYSLFSIAYGKALEPYGFNGKFFNHAWRIIGEEVTKAIISFFRDGKLLKEINFTIITLVPKVQNPFFLFDYRSISCCNTLYKCITKIIANRIKEILPQLVSPSQSAFVPGRKIVGNVLLAQELLRNYHKDTTSPRCTIKVDLHKAYDTVKWSFLFQILEVMGFPASFID